MSDVAIFRRKNSDVRFRFGCLTIVGCLARQPTVAIWMRMGGANYVITGGWRWHSALAFEASDAADDNLVDGQKQYSIHDLS